jgi:Fe-Mn family superoxide dismutase
MKYEAKKFDHLLGTNGFSDELLKNHFTLYEGYVTNTNKISEALAELVKKDETDTPQYAELKRRLGWEFNGMRLHEYYFGNMVEGGSAIGQSSPFTKKITEDFGSYESWEKDFQAIGEMRGIGWAILYYDTMGNRLINTWIDEHDTGHLSGAAPLLIMDVFEHAFMLDYGVKRDGYIEAFFNAIDWKIVTERFQSASSIAKATTSSK